MDAFTKAWLDKQGIKLGTQRKRSICHSVRTRQPTDYRSVSLESWTLKNKFLRQIPLRLLGCRSKPLLFPNDHDLTQWVNDGGLHQPSTGAPAPTPLYTRPDLPFDPYKATSYKKPWSPSTGAATQSVIDASRILYQLNPELIMENNMSLFRIDGKPTNRRLPDRWHEHLTFVRTSIQLSAAFVAHSVLHASPRLCSVTPVRVGQHDVNPQSLIESNEYWALIIGTSCSSSGTAAYTLLPVQLEMYGSTRMRGTKKYTNTDPHDRYTAHSDYVKFVHVNKTTDEVEVIDNDNRRVPRHDPVVEKLGWLPHLRCTDVEAWHKPGFLSSEDWTPRQYTTSWQLSPSGVPGRMFGTGTLGTYARRQNNLHLFSDIRRLATEIVTQAELHSVSFTDDAMPSIPFTIINVNDFYFTCDVRPKTPEPPPLDPKMVLVNGEESCGFSVQCHKRKASNSYFCVEHHVIAARLYLSLSNDEMERWRGQAIVRPSYASQTVRLTRPQNPCTLDALRSIHWTYLHRIVWVIDVEFATVRGGQPVPFCIIIRDA
jgi:hypothetical protein